MVNVRTIEAGKYNLELADALKKVDEIEMPEWANFIKTGAAKQRPNNDPDFWQKRAASILRQIYLNDVVGVQRLRTRYGSKKNRGVKPRRFKRGAGKNIRLILQQSEKAGFVEKVKGKVNGRKLTNEGKKFLEEVAEKSGEKK
jgi:small subunit ribosomal protein S19e